MGQVSEGEELANIILRLDQILTELVYIATHFHDRQKILVAKTKAFEAIREMGRW